jgi:hypothetical protein
MKTEQMKTEDKKNKNVKGDKKIDLAVGKIDLPKIEIEKYIGKKATIEKVGTYEGQYGPYVKIETEVVDTFGSGERAVELRASKILGLQQDENGKWGYGDGTKLDLFLKKYKVTDIKQLIGTEVILQSVTAKNESEFLTFN